MSKKSNIWFKAVRGSYLPANWRGWLTYIPFIAYLVGSIVIAKDHSSSWGFTLFLIFPQWIAAAVVMQWIAEHRS